VLEYQRLQSTERVSLSPAYWLPEAIPEVDDSRPPCCGKCDHPAKLGDRVFLYGHGHGVRNVVVFPAFDGAPSVVGSCWKRRYRCIKCGAAVTVLPRGVMPRFLYCTAAIVVALFLVAARPVGHGLTQEKAYKRQGMNRVTSWQGTWSYQWRSLDRWRKRAAEWWPGRATGGLAGLLTEFLERGGDGGLQSAACAAVASPACWGRAM